jgi:hypothetical protein
MDKWTNVEVLLFVLLLMLVLIGLSNRTLIPYINPTRGLKGTRVPINGRW